MMKKNLGPLTMMGFARYNSGEGVKAEELIDACLTWRQEFLEQQEGIAMHCFLGNLKGQFADAIMAVDRTAFQEMSKRHPEAKSSQSFMALLDLNSVRLAANEILKEGAKVPDDFSCIEFGTFNARQNVGFSETKMLQASRKVETEYLSRFPDSREHFMGRVDAETYSEISFVQTLGAAREICNGYLSNDVCKELLALMDVDTTEVEFWYVLA